MASVEAVKQALLKVSKDKDWDKDDKHKNAGGGATGSRSTGAAAVAFPTTRRKSAFISFESRLMNSFHVGDPLQNQITIAKFVTTDTGCSGFVMVRVLDTGLFRLYCRGTTPNLAPETYNIEDFTCIQAVIKRKQEVVQSDEDFKALSLLVQWKPLFTIIPDVVLAIPVIKIDQRVMAIVAIGFNKRLPSEFMSNKFPYLRDFLDTVVPYAMTIQAMYDNDEENTRMKLVLDALDFVDKDKRDPIKCAMTIGTELGKLTGCCNISIFTADYSDNRLLKLNSVGKGKTSQWGCPDAECHDSPCFSFDDKLPIGWSAIHRKPLKINESSECNDYGMSKKALHSVGTCSCKNIMCVPVNDHSGERTLLIELTDKEGLGFSARDLEVVSLFSQNAASIYSCCVMLAHREKSCRRNSMLSSILLNIEPIKHMKVEQFLSHQRRISADTLYNNSFLEFSFSVKGFTEWEMAGGILYAFNDLDMLSTFKIRRTTLIRFILSSQQGYRPLPYHNWQHACSVCHFGYLLIKNLKLMENGYITPLQAFAILVSGLAHDIDHRGTNNRFQSCTNSDLFQLYNTQESILERHHLSIAMSILRREDCNLIENLSSGDYKEFIELLTWNILATDISKYLQTRDSNFKIIQHLKKGVKEDQFALLSLMMTASDVNDCVKTWDDNLVSARQILTEFFEQGDMEKDMGMTPMPMMDRTVAYIPEVEFKFLTGIVMPVYNEMATAFPILDSCTKTLQKFENYWEYSTLVFDAHPEIFNKLDILKLPSMKEENLKKIGLDKNNPNIRSLASGQPRMERRGTTVDIRRTFVSKAIVAPEAEFRAMFTDRDDCLRVRPSAKSLSKQRYRCCKWLRKKSKKKDEEEVE